MLAMGMLLRQMGKRADLVTADRIPAVYRNLPDADLIQTVLGVHGPYDAVILLECDGLERTRLSGLDTYFLINIDHHLSGRPYGQLNWIDREACSVGELVLRLVNAAGGIVTADMATCLYTTLMTDTGGFLYGGLTAGTFGLLQGLVLAGADPVTIARDVYFSNPTSKIQLLGIALSNLQVQNRIAWLSVTSEEMLRISATEEDCEGVVNHALSIANVDVAVFLRELPDSRIRLSLRSKGGVNESASLVNVSAIAASLGGGGHENAAGCTLDGPLCSAIEEILCPLRNALIKLRS